MISFPLQGSGKTLAFGIPILQYILNNCGTKRDTTGHAQKLNPAKVKKNKKSDNDGPLKSRREKKHEREENIIDLNEVLHHVETSESVETSDEEFEDSEFEMDALEKDCTIESFADETEVNKEVSIASGSELEDDDRETEGGSVSSIRKANVDTGLVECKDDIPDEEFQKMIAGESNAWESGDEEMTKLHKSKKQLNIEKESRSRDTKDGSHDLTQDQGERFHCGLIALILAPTRELAIQVHDHITAVAKYTDIKVQL